MDEQTVDSWMDAPAGDLPLSNVERESLMTAVQDRIDLAADPENLGAQDDEPILLALLMRLELLTR